MNVYVDSSVLMRIVLGERGRLAAWGTFRGATASVLVEVECLRTLDRLSLKADLTPEVLAERRAAVYQLLEEMEVVDLDRAVLARASQPFPTPLGTLDAIHLATAVLRREQEGPELLEGPEVFATHDKALALAARSMGFEVLGV